MKLPSTPAKGLILKGIFAVSVVAITATVGVVGFAQAARVSALDNGYGGGVAAVQAAIQAFQNTVNAASTKFNNDIRACLSGNQVDAASANAFSTQANTGISQFSAKFAGPSAIDRNDAKMEQRLNAATATQDAQLVAANAQLLANIERNAAANSRTNRTELRQCIQDARQDFRSTVREAQQTLRQAIRDAFRS